MPKEIILFLSDDLPFDKKFYKLMDLLLANNSPSRVESVLFISIFYIQIISSFFAQQVGVFNAKNSTTDRILNYIEKIFRLTDVFRSDYTSFRIFIIVIFVLIIIAILHFIFTCLGISRYEKYSYNKIIINYYIKIFIYILFNAIFDLSFSNFCFGFTGNNPNFDEEVKCYNNSKIYLYIISIILIIFTLIMHIFIQIYYSDSFCLTNSYYSKISCDYDLYMEIYCFFNSLFLTQAHHLKKQIFLIYNLIYSIAMFMYYIKHLLFYDNFTNILIGIFHTLHTFTSIFSIIFAYIDFEEKGVVYMLSCCIVCYTYYKFKNKIENYIFYSTNINRLPNKYYFFHLFKILIDRIINIDENDENKAFIAGIMQTLLPEIKDKNIVNQMEETLYLPINKTWSDNTKRKINDDVYLKHFCIFVLNHFIYNYDCAPDVYLNLSLYYLMIIGNYCQAMYYYQKTTEIKMTKREEFTFNRLRIKIGTALIEKLKLANEPNVSLSTLNASLYYKYDSLSQNFIDAINEDVDLSLEFWKIFKKSLKESNFQIDFNKIFELTDKIHTTKKNIEKMWNDLLKIYSGANEYFEFYLNYIEQINDDDLHKRDLEVLKRKNVNFTDNINQNYYSILFNKETGIMIVNADKGSEGIIMHCNKKIEQIFNYKNSELKELNISKIMPKLFEKDHSKYMERYFNTGVKRYIETTDFSTYAKDKKNYIIKIKNAIKLLPVLNYNVFFVGIIIKDNIDDIILTDENFNIQGMSHKLMKILNIHNKNLFQDNDVPFYIICKKFVNFYNILLRNQKKKQSNNKDEKSKEKDKEKENMNDNIEISENVELEYEIKLPQFLIDYSEKTNNSHFKHYKKKLLILEECQILHKDEESELLLSEEKNEEKIEEIKKTNEDNNNKNIVKKEMKLLVRTDSIRTTLMKSPNLTPYGETPTPNGITPTPGEDTTFNDNDQEINFNKKKEDEENFIEKVETYQKLFNENKFSDLEELIDKNNENSSSPEYKFNFTFDIYKFDNNKKISYIIRCIDNKSDFGESEEKSANMDTNAIKYKKEKLDAIKPLFEINESEKKQLIDLPRTFLQLASENKNFQKLLQLCKNEIKTLSKAHGTKQDEILQDENASQTSQVGFDSGLVKKNRIEEIRSNLLKNVSSFYSIKYITTVIILFGVLTFIFSINYIILLKRVFNNANCISILNLDLLQTTLLTNDIVNIFLSLRTLFLKNAKNQKFDFKNLESRQIKNNIDYYNYMENLVLKSYYNLVITYGNIEMKIPKYLDETQLKNLYWNHINVSYHNTLYTSMNNNSPDDESFPTAMDQFLSNAFNYVNDNCFKIIYDESLKCVENYEEFKFNYSTYILIENAYNNILPNQFIKVIEIPKILSDYNDSKKTQMVIVICIYAFLMVCLCPFYLIMIRITNKHMSDGIEKVTKINLEKIEETIKTIETFNDNLRKFRDRDFSSLEESDIKDNADLEQKKLNEKTLTKTNDLSTPVKKNENQTSALVGNNGFNTEFKKYISLNILNKYFYHLIYILCIVFIVIPIYIYSNDVIDGFNELLLVQNYIYGSLITASASILQVKCFMSDCKNETVLDYSELGNSNQRQKMLKDLSCLKLIEHYYRNEYSSDVCLAAFDQAMNKEDYDDCKDNQIIKNSGNIENLLAILDNTIINIYKKNEMEEKDNDYIRKSLFNTTYFQQIEEIYFRFLVPINERFEQAVKFNLDLYIRDKEILLISLSFCLSVLMIIACFFYIYTYIPKLINYLSVSRCIMKIIPTSVIINTQELESWIENKY